MGPGSLTTRVMATMVMSSHSSVILPQRRPPRTIPTWLRCPRCRWCLRSTMRRPLVWSTGSSKMQNSPVDHHCSCCTHPSWS